VNEGCASRLANGHINMEKARVLAEHVSQFMRWKDMECPYEKSSRLLDYFERSPALGPAGLDWASFEAEAADSPQEKELYRQLKAELRKTC